MVKVLKFSHFQLISKNAIFSHFWSSIKKIRAHRILKFSDNSLTDICSTKYFETSDALFFKFEIMPFKNGCYGNIGKNVQIALFALRT